VSINIQIAALTETLQDNLSVYWPDKMTYEFYVSTGFLNICTESISADFINRETLHMF